MISNEESKVIPSLLLLEFNFIKSALKIGYSFLEYYSSCSNIQKALISVGGLFFSVTSLVSFYCYKSYRDLEKIKGYKQPTKEETKKWKIAKQIRLRMINLDGGLPLQKVILKKYDPIELLDLHEWGPAMRMDCFWWTLWGFEKALSRVIGKEFDDDVENKPLITFFGANDFHHVSLSLIRRFRQPFNVVIFDNHPDWFKYYPIGLHCGCWYTHVLDLPTVQYGFHFGGDSGEFEDEKGYHPWRQLNDGTLSVFPTVTKWKGLQWDNVKHHETLRKEGLNITRARVRELLEPHRQKLEEYPLYITLDKDCLQRKDNLQNWNSGSLSRDELIIIIETLIEFSKGRLLALDVTGDFTKVNVCGVYRHHLHQTQHEDENNDIKQEEATPNNQFTNLEILKCIERALDIPQQFKAHAHAKNGMSSVFRKFINFLDSH